MGFMDGISSGAAKFVGFDGKEATYKVQGVDQPLNGQQFIAHILEAVGGYIKFNGKETQPERRMGNVFPKDEAPDRDTLGEAAWKSPWSTPRPASSTSSSLCQKRHLAQ